MMLTQQVFSNACLLAGELDKRHTDLLQILCRAAVNALRNQLRDGITEEDCKADFIAAASLYALAALNEAGQTGGMEEFHAGDLTIRRSSADAPSRCLHRQAELIMMPFLKDRFSFRGV